jgi:hypothetical protein
LMSLPKSYSTLVTVITHDKTTLKLEMVKSTILAEWGRRHHSSQDDESTALVVRGRQP